MIKITNKNLVWLKITAKAAQALFDAKAMSVHVLYEDETSLEITTQQDIDNAVKAKKSFALSLGSVSVMQYKIDYIKCLKNRQ